MTDATKSLRVMICVDDSEYADKAFQYYVDKIRKPDHELLIAHVAEMIYPMPLTYGAPGARMGMPGPSPAVAQEMMEENRKKVKALHANFETKCQTIGISSDFLTLHDGGDGTGAAIVEAIKNHDVKCVIMGSRGLGVIRRTFLGSVSDYVLHHSHVPTLICPKQ